MYAMPFSFQMSRYIDNLQLNPQAFYQIYNGFITLRGVE